jgi:hypothetical protein
VNSGTLKTSRMHPPNEIRLYDKASLRSHVIHIVHGTPLLRQRSRDAVVMDVTSKIDKVVASARIASFKTAKLIKLLLLQTPGIYL